ncbi:MAG: AMP-binding protein [Planctomycetes bacterium]|nr:AMP-binding protein [Planctomycetota bacterium]
MSILHKILSGLHTADVVLETYDRQGNCVLQLSGREFAQAACSNRRAFSGWATAGYNGHKVVGLLFKSEETIEFLVTAFAALAEGFTVVPFYPNWSAELQLRYLLQYRIRAMAVGQGFARRVEDWGEHLDRIVKIPQVKACPIDEKDGPIDEKGGPMDGSAGQAGLDYPESLPESHPCAWIFTSGTSSAVPKCTVISLSNIAAAIDNIQKLDFLYPGMTLHSPLSTSHIFAFVVVLGFLAIRPRRILFSDVQYLARLPQERIGKIDGLILVPIVLNRLRSSFYEQLMGLGPLRHPMLEKIPLRLRRLLKSFVQQAEETVVAVETGNLARFLFWPKVAVARWLFGRKIRERLGSPDFVVVGGAKPSLQSMAFLDVMGVRCLQGWGMTETTGPLAVCSLSDRFRGAFGTCGELFDQTRAYLDNGELIIEGPQVAEGYVEPDGTFVPFHGVKRTGDYAEFDRRGRLKVLGKVSDRITLTNGLNYNPLLLEEALLAADLSRNHLLEEAVVIGDGQPRLGCVFFLREPQNLNSEKGFEVRQYLASLVREYNLSQPVDEHIGPWTIHPAALRESEFLGPSGKLRRRLVEGQFQHLFEESRYESVHP